MAKEKWANETTTMVELKGRRITVWLKEYDNGRHRVGAFFTDKSIGVVVRQNSELRARILELEELLNISKKTFIDAVNDESEVKGCVKQKNT
jgi:Tfp pilus assembly ATPase PilU